MSPNQGRDHSAARLNLLRCFALGTGQEQIFCKIETRIEGIFEPLCIVWFDRQQLIGEGDCRAELLKRELDAALLGVKDAKSSVGVNQLLAIIIIARLGKQVIERGDLALTRRNGLV